MAEFKPISDDDRDLLARQATAAERRNRPKHLCTLAFIALVAALLAAIWGYTSFRRADARAIRERNNLVNLQRIGAEIDALKKAAETTTGTLDPVQGLQTKLEGYALEYGLTKPALPSENRARSTVDKVQRMTLAYKLRHPTPGPPMQWIKRALDEVPGLEVYMLKVKPEARDWSFDVTFSRWETAP